MDGCDSIDRLILHMKGLGRCKNGKVTMTTESCKNGA